jgi:hypothetical protein
MSGRLIAAATFAVITAAAPARAGNGVELLRFMPEDAQVYLVVDVAGARDASLFKDGMAKLVSLAPGEVALVQAAGLDPANAIDTLALGGRTGGAHDRDQIVLVAEGKQVQKVAELFSKDPKVKVAAYHGVTYWQNGEAAMALVQKRLFMAKPGWIETAIDLALGKAKSAARSPKSAALRAVIAATDVRQDVWAALVLPAEVADPARAQGLDLQGVSFGATLSSSLALEIKVLSATDASAARLLDQINAALPQLTPALGTMGLAATAKTLQIDKDGAAVRLAMTLTKAEIETLAQLLQSTLGGMSFGGP